MFSATDRSSAGKVLGATPRLRSALIAVVVWEIHLCMSVDHSCRTSGLVALAAAPATATARCEPDTSKNASMRARQSVAGSPDNLAPSAVSAVSALLFIRSSNDNNTAFFDWK